MTRFNLTHFVLVTRLSTVFADGLNHPLPLVVSTVTVGCAVIPHAPLAKNTIHRIGYFLTGWWYLLQPLTVFGYKRIATLHLQKASVTICSTMKARTCGELGNDSCPFSDAITLA
jgi:hypothetical protein